MVWCPARCKRMTHTQRSWLLRSGTSEAVQKLTPRNFSLFIRLLLFGLRKHFLMGEFDCSACGKSFRSGRALNFHMENHKDEKRDAEWQQKRERSRSRIRELSTDRESLSHVTSKVSGERSGRAGRSALKDYGLSESHLSRLSKMDASKMNCPEPGCPRSFSTKMSLDFHMEKDHGKKQKGALEINRKARI